MAQIRSMAWRRVALSIIAFCAATAVQPQAHAQPDRCGDILSPILLSKVTSENRSRRMQATKHFACSKAASEVIQTFSSAGTTDAGGTFFGDVFGFDIKTDKSIATANMQKWQASSCQGLSNSDHADAYSYLSRTEPMPDVAQRWSECMRNRDGLICYATASESGIVLTVAWKSDYSEVPRVDSFREYRARATYEMAPNGSRLFRGDKTYVRPAASNEDVQYALNILVDRGEASKQCRVLVPKVVPDGGAVTTNNGLVGSWCRQRRPDRPQIIKKQIAVVGDLAVISFEGRPDVEQSRVKQVASNYFQLTEPMSGEEAKSIVTIGPPRAPGDPVQATSFYQFERLAPLLKTRHVVVEGNIMRDVTPDAFPGGAPAWTRCN